MPPPPGFPPSSFSAPSASSSSVPPLSLFASSSFLPPTAPPPPIVSASSSSSSFGSLPSSALADHQARLLGLSADYQSLARWFLTSGGSDFAGLVRSSFPHLLPDLARHFSSGSSLFLTTLRSVSPPSLAPPFSSPPCARCHLPLWCLPLLPAPLPPPTLPFPLTCLPPPCLGCRLLLPLPLSLYPLRLLLCLPCRLLLGFLTLLLLLPFLSRVLPWCMGWVWVSLLLLGFPLPPFTRLLYLLPLHGLPHTRMIPMRLQLLLLRPILLPMRMSDSLTTSTIRSSIILGFGLF